MAFDVKETLSKMTLEDKINFLTGYKSWYTQPYDKKYGVPKILLTDGPAGVRKKSDDKGSGATGLGVACKATTFPLPATVANSFNKDLAYQIGLAMGSEAKAMELGVLLAPGMNIKRNSRGGRSFEYYSEDPVLSGNIGGNFAKGVEAAGVSACLKHFAFNNCEYCRYINDSIVDERAMREIYLKNFGIAIKVANPSAMMCAYNKINGTQCASSRYLNTDILRGELGFNGFIMTDWGATTDRGIDVYGGMDLDMPGSVRHNTNSIIDNLNNGTLTEADIDLSVERILRVVNHVTDTPKPEKPLSELFEDHYKLTVDGACEGAVLFENKNNALPLKKDDKILVVGHLFERMRYQGAGSSGSNPAHKVMIKDTFDKEGVDYKYIVGYKEMEDEKDDSLINEVEAEMANYETIVFFGGLTDISESEGFDRPNILIPENQRKVIDKLATSGKKVIVILYGGAAMEVTSFKDKVDAILDMYLPGEGCGESTYRLIFGLANPTGRTNETWVNNADLLNNAEFGQILNEEGKDEGKGTQQIYKESIFVGYRYYGLNPEKIVYPFGYGLSYSSYEYSNLKVNHADGKTVVTVDVTNTSDVDGKEVVQLYIGNNANTKVFKAKKELKDFTKVAVKAHETVTATLEVNDADLAYYNVNEKRWIVETGTYKVIVGKNALDEALTADIEVAGEEPVEVYSEEIMNIYNNIGNEMIDNAHFEEVIGYKIPETNVKDINIETPLVFYKQTRCGRFLMNIIEGFLKGGIKKAQKKPDSEEKDVSIKSQMFALNFLPTNSARSMVQCAGGAIQLNIANALWKFGAGHPFRAIGAACCIVPKRKLKKKKSK